ncbi:MAG TPA: protein kinase, partial [Thermoanaerobaculia bacterium]|nr:protein kinase [Thermoanaerobaculia bacterium]
MGELASDTRRQFGEYEVESVLGKGAMGMVYLARDKRIGRRVALKTVQVQQQFEDESEAAEFYQRLQREAEVCGAMQHPNIVTLYEPGYENNVISFLATEWVDGESLRDRLKRSKPLPVGEAVRISEDILRGLAYAHAKGVVHRDIKPANILLSANGQAKIADFGIARPVDSTLTAVGSMLGTPNYMSPEQVKCAAITERSDLFSAGVVMYEMLTGVKPFSAADVSSILRNVVERETKPANEVNPEVPEAIARIVDQLLQKAPEARYGSAADALAELQRVRKALLPDLIPPQAEGVHETVAIGSTSKRLGATTDKRFDDVTPALGNRTRIVPPIISFSVIGILAAGLFGAIAVIHLESNPAPRAVMTQQQHAEFAAKKKALTNARALLAAGQYDASFAAFDQFVKQYPDSVAGIEGRADAARAIDQHNAQTTVTATAASA